MNEELKSELIKSHLENQLREASRDFIKYGVNNRGLLETWTLCIPQILVNALKPESIKNPQMAAKDFGFVIESAIIDLCNIINERRENKFH